MRTRDHLEAGLDLLDRHVVDRDGRPVGKVDDLELSEGEDGTLEVSALLLGPQALGQRVGGVLGRTMRGVGIRLTGDENGARIDLATVDEIGVVIKLKLPLAQLPVGRFEGWVREHLIRPLPGADRATG